MTPDSEQAGRPRALLSGLPAQLATMTSCQRLLSSRAAWPPTS